MSATELLTVIRQAGIVLQVDGDRLTYDAPKGAMTTELRDAVVRHKPALLALLRPVTEFVTLKGGLTLPVPAFALALDLERRGFRMSLDADQQVQIEPTAALTEADLAAIRRWRLHLGAIIGYTCEVVA